MHRMRVVTFESSLVSEFHSAADDEALSARRNIFADVRFQNEGDVIFEVADFAEHAILLCFRDAGFQTKCKHVNEHWCGISRLKKALEILGDGVHLCQ